MDNVGDGVPMDETPSNTSLLSFDLGSGLTPKMSWLASRTRDGLGPSALQRQGSGGESLGSLPSRDLLANLDSPSVAPYLQSLMSPREATALPAEPSRPPTTQEAESLENWASLAKRPFSGGALANSSARLFARRLSEAVQRHMAGSDGTPIGHLGQQGHALIERAVHWPARTLRGVIRLLECLDRSPVCDSVHESRPHRLKIGKETTHVIVRWTRVASTSSNRENTAYRPRRRRRSRNSSA